MKLTRKTLVACLLLVGGCGNFGGRGVAPSRAIAPVTSGGGNVSTIPSAVLPRRVTRPAAIGSWTVAHDPAGPAGSTIAAIGVAPGCSDVLAAVSALGRIDRVTGQGSTTEVQLVFDATSFAAATSAAFAATGNELTARAGSVYERSATGLWRLSRDGTHRTCLVASLGSATYAISSDPDGGMVASVHAPTGWTDVSFVPSFVATAAVEADGSLWVGGRSTITTAPRLLRGTGTSFTEVALPVVPRPGEQLSVTALACAPGVLYAAVEATDASGAVLRGHLVGIAGSVRVAIAELDRDAPAALAAADGTVYAGTRSGRVLWLDEQGRLREDAPLPASRGVSSLASAGGDLLAGVRGTGGAQLLRRSGAPAGLAIASIAPASGPTAGGTVVTIRGSSFANVTQVTLGGAPLGGLQVTADAITGTTAPHAQGTVDVVVTTATGTATLTGGFTYGTAGRSFSGEVQPLLQTRCTSCHGPGGVMASRPLVTYQDVRAGRTAANQPFVVPGSPATSVLHQKIHGGSMQVYLNDPVAQARLISEWIEQGAADN